MLYFVCKIDGDVMKRIFVVLLSFCFVNVYADKCTYDQKYELTKLANEIKIDYDEKSKDVHIKDEYYDYKTKDYWLEISIYNIPSDFILEITNDYNKEVINVYKSDIKDGVYRFKDYDYYKIINYSVNVINTSTCDRYTVKTIKYKKPMYNPNWSYDICKENENVPFCNKYILSSKKVYSMGIGLEEAIDNFKKTGDEKVEDNKEGNWFKKNYKYLFIGVFGAVAVGGIIFYINKKRGEI